MRFLRTSTLTLTLLVLRVQEKFKRGCPWGQRFFGLTSENKVEIHKLVFSLVYSSNGAFTFHDVYSMPVHLRMFYMKELGDQKSREQEAVQQAGKRNPNRKRK